MIRTAFALAALTALLHAAPASAQDRWAFEIRANGAIATQDVDRQTEQNDFGLDATLRYRFLPHLAAYAGWDWVRFAAAESLAGADTDIEETGYAFGLRFEHPISAGSPTAAWVRVGGTYDHVEMENGDGDITADSGHGMGWEAGAGLAVRMGERWSLTPGIRYRSLSRDLEVDQATVPVELRYVAVEIGVARSF